MKQLNETHYTAICYAAVVIAMVIIISLVTLNS
jgi:hypothetical protein